MSWLDSIKTDLIIQTGDGKQYKPQWLNATKEVSYNVAEFDFPSVKGTLVKRSMPKGAKYNIEIYFQGESHLDESKDFEKSSEDSRPWIVTHPFYGRINAQPTSLIFDNTVMNVTKITGTILETISEEYPKGATDPADKISADCETCEETLATNYANNITPEEKDINYMTEYTKKFSAISSQIIKGAALTNEYLNSLNKAYSLILSATSAPLQAMRGIQNVIKAPAKFKSNVKDRMNVLNAEFTSLRSLVSPIATKSQKHFYQTSAASVISATALTASTPTNKDYSTRNDVLATIQQVIGMYDSYISDMDVLQTENGGLVDSFIPDADSLLLLSQLINFTLSNLFNIATGAKQQRSIVLESDSNWILLAHRFYGLKADDSTLVKLMEENNAGLNSILQVRKNSIINYFV